MPKPQLNAKAVGGAGKREEDDKKPCPYCAQPVDKEEEAFITVTCNKCGDNDYHVECVTAFLEKKFKMTTSKQNKNAAFYLRQPANELVRSRCPAALAEDDCPGFVGAATLFKPMKPVPQPPVLPPRAKQQAAAAHKSKPPRSASGGALPRTGKLASIGSRSEASLNVPPPQPAQLGLMRDRLGRRLAPPAAPAPKKKKAPLKFVGDVRPEELTLCRLWEATGECTVPTCVFAHGEEELEQREEEYRQEQARLKKEAKARHEQAQKTAAPMDPDEEARALAAATAAAAAELGSGEGSGEAVQGSGSGSGGDSGFTAASRCGNSASVWDELVARARAGMQAALGGAGSVQSGAGNGSGGGGGSTSSSSGTGSGTATPLPEVQDSQEDAYEGAKLYQSDVQYQAAEQYQGAEPYQSDVQYQAAEQYQGTEQYEYNTAEEAGGYTHSTAAAQQHYAAYPGYSGDVMLFEAARATEQQPGWAAVPAPGHGAPSPMPLPLAEVPADYAAGFQAALAAMGLAPGGAVPAMAASAHGADSGVDWGALLGSYRVEAAGGASGSTFGAPAAGLQGQPGPWQNAIVAQSDETELEGMLALLCS